MVVPPFQMSCPSGEAMPGAKIKAYETRELLGRWEAQGYRDTCIPTGYPRVKIHGHCVYVYMRGSCDIIPLPWCNNVQLRGAPPQNFQAFKVGSKDGKWDFSFVSQMDMKNSNFGEWSDLLKAYRSIELQNIVTRGFTWRFHRHYLVCSERFVGFVGIIYTPILVGIAGAKLPRCSWIPGFAGSV